MYTVKFTSPNKWLVVTSPLYRWRLGNSENLSVLSKFPWIRSRETQNMNLRLSYFILPFCPWCQEDCLSNVLEINSIWKFNNIFAAISSERTTTYYFNSSASKNKNRMRKRPSKVQFSCCLEGNCERMESKNKKTKICRPTDA